MAGGLLGHVGALVSGLGGGDSSSKIMGVIGSVAEIALHEYHPFKSKCGVWPTSMPSSGNAEMTWLGALDTPTFALILGIVTVGGTVLVGLVLSSGEGIGSTGTQEAILLLVAMYAAVLALYSGSTRWVGISGDGVIVSQYARTVVAPWDCLQGPMVRAALRGVVIPLAMSERVAVHVSFGNPVPPRCLVMDAAQASRVLADPRCPKLEISSPARHLIAR